MQTRAEPRHTMWALQFDSNLTAPLSDATRSWTIVL